MGEREDVVETPEKDRVTLLEQQVSQRLAHLPSATASEVGELVRELGKALRESEERFRTLFEQTPDGIYRSTPEGRFLDVNPAMVRMFGYASREEMLEVDIPRDIYFSPEERERLAGNQGIVVFRQRRKDGTEIWVEDHPGYVYDDQGRVILNEGILRDVTSRRQAEDRLKALNETLEQRVAERTAESQWRANQLQRLTAQMTQAEERERHRLSQILHDHLQQLLVAAKFRLDLARRGGGGRQADEAIREALGLLDDAINEARSLAKELSPPILYERGLAAGLEWLGREQEVKHRLKVTVHADTAAEPGDLTTTVVVFQATRELLLNAVKHARASSLHVRMNRSRDDRLEVVVADDGVGFDPEVLHGPNQGEGFGLFSTRERLGVIGGHLTIVSSRGKGTQATMTVPCCWAGQAESDDEATRRMAARPASLPPHTGRIRVLLADDHAVVRTCLADTLMKHPDLNLVGEARNGKEATEMAIQLQPEVVLMDVTMPNMDGIEATRRIKRASPGTSIIGLSMHERDDMALAMKEAGAAEYLTKSSPVEELISAILRTSPRRALSRPGGSMPPFAPRK